MCQAHFLIICGVCTDILQERCSGFGLTCLKTQSQKVTEPILGQAHSMPGPFSHSTISLGHESALVRGQAREISFISKLD